SSAAVAAAMEVFICFPSGFIVFVIRRDCPPGVAVLWRKGGCRASPGEQLIMASVNVVEPLSDGGYGFGVEFDAHQMGVPFGGAGPADNAADQRAGAIVLVDPQG